MMICVRDAIPPAPIPWIAVVNGHNGHNQNVYQYMYEGGQCLLLEPIRNDISVAAPQSTLPSANRKSCMRNSTFRPKV